MPQRWIFGRFEFDPERGVLQAEGKETPLSPKPCALLEHLIVHRNRVVPKAELLAAAWPGTQVSNAAYLSVVRDLRRALGDDAVAPRFVETVRGRGLRFAHAVEVLSGTEPAEASSYWRRTAASLEEAVRALDRVHDGRGDTPESPAARAELLLALGRARWQGGALADARLAFQQAGVEARRAGDPDLAAHAALGLAGRSDAPVAVQAEAVEAMESALTALSGSATAVRAELLARLGTELYYTGDFARCEALADEGLRVAEAVGEPTGIAYALTAQQFARYRPDVSPAERMALTERAEALVSGRPPTDVLALVLQERFVDQLELGDGAGLRETLRRYREVGEALRASFFLWLGSAFAGSVALQEGELDRAEAMAHETHELGRRIDTPNALPAFAAQLFALRAEQGRLAELAPLVDAGAEQFPDLPLFRAGQVAAYAAAEDAGRARAGLEALLADEGRALARDQHWLPLLTLLAGAAIRLGARDAAGVLAGHLRPFADRIVVLGYGAAVLGSVSQVLGDLSELLGDEEGARAAWTAALAHHERLGSRIWVARSRSALKGSAIPT